MEPTPGQAVLVINGVEYPGSADEILKAFSQVITQLKEEGTAMFTANRSDGLTEMILVNQGTQMSVKTVSSDGAGPSLDRVVLKPVDPNEN